MADSCFWEIVAKISIKTTKHIAKIGGSFFIYFYYSTVCDIIVDMTEEIYKEFRRKKAEILTRPETKELSPEEEKEILKEAVFYHIEKSQPITQAQRQTIVQTAQRIKDQPKERQIQLLIDLALNKGVIEAVEVAKSLDSPYLVDELHDTLVDELYNKLVTEGKLEKI